MKQLNKSDVRTCPYCKGTGKDESGNKCVPCHGVGKVHKSDGI